MLSKFSRNALGGFPESLAKGDLFVKRSIKSFIAYGDSGIWTEPESTLGNNTCVYIDFRNTAHQITNFGFAHKM